MMEIYLPKHYENEKSIETIDDLKSMFPDGEAHGEDWCLFSTSGIHGTYTKLDEIERYFNDPDKYFEDEGLILEEDKFAPTLTVLVIQPRLVKMLYGNIGISKDDIPYLRKLANSSIEAIKKSQKGNL